MEHETAVPYVSMKSMSPGSHLKRTHFEGYSAWFLLPMSEFLMSGTVMGE
jgi:hypothetical protein